LRSQDNEANRNRLKMFAKLQAYKVYEKHVNKANYLEQLGNQKSTLGVNGMSGAVERLNSKQKTRY
jgi:hypothetical protein